jgi:ABC-2 type transport system permease protein
MPDELLAGTVAALSARGPRLTWTVGWTMIARSWRLTVRNVDWFMTSLSLPVILMLMMVCVFGGAIQPGGHYVDYVAPGVLIVCVGFGAGNTAVSVAQDLTTGIIDRFRSTDVSGEVLINGHVVASVARNLVATALVFGVAFALGFRSSAGPVSWLVAVGVLTLFILALSWLAATVGVMARSVGAASGMAFFIAFLAYPSSALVLPRTMPAWLRGFAQGQPITPVVDTVRGLLSGGTMGASAWEAAAWSLGIIAVSMVAAGAIFRHRTR